MKPLTILIVEDNPDHAELTKLAIRKTNNANRIDIVEDGEKALDYLFNRNDFSDKNDYPQPGLVLLDIKLPGIDGIELLKRIKQNEELNGIEVIVLTTSDRPEDIDKAHEYGAVSFLTKPVRHSELLKRLGEIKHHWVIVEDPESPL